jgi:hypothetical protein
VPPLAQSVNAEAIAGESSAVPLEMVYLEGIIQVLPTVEFCARTAEAPNPTERSNESILTATQRMRVCETIASRETVWPYTNPLIATTSSSRGVVLPHDAGKAGT